MRKGVTALFREYSRELTRFGVESTGRIFEEIVVQNKDQIKLDAERAPGKFTTENYVAALDRIIQSELGKRLTETPTESAHMMLDRSLEALQNINSRLRQMARSRNLSRHDELGRRLITTWWTLLQKIEVEGSQSEKLIKRKLMKTRIDLQED